MTWFYFLASLALLALALGIAQHYLGSYMARVFTSDKDTCLLYTSPSPRD